jgi:hypothetical protein
MAIYSDDENEPAWYEAVIDSRDREGEENSFGGGHRYWVTFSAYGNTESVDLGDMKLADRSSCSGGEDGGRDGKEEAGDLLTKVLDKERQVTPPLSVSTLNLCLYMYVINCLCCDVLCVCQCVGGDRGQWQWARIMAVGQSPIRVPCPYSWTDTPCGRRVQLALPAPHRGEIEIAVETGVAVEIEIGTDAVTTTEIGTDTGTGIGIRIETAVGIDTEIRIEMHPRHLKSSHP